MNDFISVVRFWDVCVEGDEARRSGVGEEAQRLDIGYGMIPWERGIFDFLNEST